MGTQRVTTTGWQKLPLSLAELCIDTTLRCGQSFRWRQINNEWHCVLQGRIVSLRQDPSHLFYRAIWPKPAPSLSLSTSACSPPMAPGGGDDNDDDTASLLHNYFALSHSLSALYKQWTAADANFAHRAPSFTGIRILNQDAWEALVAFICSSNNNISRISQMVQKLCTHYGPFIGTVEGEPFHDFPRPDALARSDVEAHLRELGFGYRAKYIVDTARIVAKERPADWLRTLRNPDSPALDAPRATPGGNDAAEIAAKPATYRAAHEALLELTGVGPKVADCVCLMGLGWGEAVPVDTHVWQIAQRDYQFGKGGKTKTLTKAMYDAVGDHFRNIHGPKAGWAQSVLFTANLKSFSEQASIKKAEVLVKVEEGQDSVSVDTATKTRKRKTAATEKTVKVEVEDDQCTEVKSRGTRTSRRKTVTTWLPPKVEEEGSLAAESTNVGTRTSKRRKTQA
ncbi:DNA glycosylase [Podospora appendiculata]|uniref:DNA-(apurinic or apyrimidinic site) lyase n=1 Tax=Podospora appendiculata TaxID=314037 RepID=A0AAE0XIH8_9PEZI|nr:DNA glycosylase [Podospora appendiculata]